MSKESIPANLRLLGSPVNLTYRGKKRDDKKNIRNRPRSALQNSCFTPDLQERYKRPFSADTKPKPPTYNSFLKAISLENPRYASPPKSVKVCPPTSKLLGDCRAPKNYKFQNNKELCSNASDYGSEDTFVSLGAKIKAKAQSAPKNRNPNNKNYLKYRNIAKKGRKVMDSNLNNIEGDDNAYDLDVKITERVSKSDTCIDDELLFSQLEFPTSNYECYFLPFEKEIKQHTDMTRNPIGFKIFDPENSTDIQVKKKLTKHQLSLVEEESTQDLESIPSHKYANLSPENADEFTELSKAIEDISEGINRRNSYMINLSDESKQQGATYETDDISDPKTYTDFYDDFKSNTRDSYKASMANLVIHTDVMSKDSGYQDSGLTEEKNYKNDFSLPNSTTLFTERHTNQPKSLECASDDKSGIKTLSDKRNDWNEPLKHSRLLCKDFFLKKETPLSTPIERPNSPCKNDSEPKIDTEIDDIITEANNESKANTEYPSYLLHSTTKAYTSKVIEDYKKEIQAINNLHELTLKDLQTDAISPTPLNIDRLFEQNPDLTQESSIPQDVKKDNVITKKVQNPKSPVHNVNKQDISKVSTKELIQNYFKVKGGDYNKDYLPKTLRNIEGKLIKSNSDGEESSSNKQNWNNRATDYQSRNSKTYPYIIKNHTQKNVAASKNIPLSARIESVQNDKDIDSWMSISAPSPRLLDIDATCEPRTQITRNIKEVVTEENPNRPKIDKAVEEIPKVVKARDLSSNSTVLDIYSMLKEIESYAELPVHVEKSENNDEHNAQNEENTSVPKDNFMEIFEFLEKVEQSANEVLSVVTNSAPQTIPKLEMLLRLPQTELAQRLVTATLQLEERSCCIALLQESLANHKEQMISKVSVLEKQSIRNVTKVKQECEEAIKRHQNFIDQLINDKKTLNHRIEQLVDERRSLEERWKRSAHTLEERYKLELKNQHDKMAAAQQVARQRWVRQKAEKIKELTVKGLEGELREMADRQQKEIADIKMYHAEQLGRIQSKHAADLEQLRMTMEEEKEKALIKERQLSSSRLEKQILESELTYQEQRTRLVAEMRSENERLAASLGERERSAREQIQSWREEQEKLIDEKKLEMEVEIANERAKLEEAMEQRRIQMDEELERHKREFEAEQQAALKRKVTEIAAQHKLERDREIEKAIECMEAEAQSGRKELHEALRRNKDQYEAELKELAETEQATLKRYQDAQARIRQTEDKCAELEMTISQLEIRNRVITEKNSQLEKRVDEIRTSCEATWKSKMEHSRSEMEDLRRTHEEQMHQLYAKVKVAVARKDSAIQSLTREAGKAKEKIATLEQKLAQQRKDFLKQK